MTRKKLIEMIENQPPFTREGLYTSDSPTFGRHISFEPARRFILSSLKRETLPKFKYKNPDHTGYLFNDSHLVIQRVTQELNISEYVQSSAGCYSTIISFKGLEDSN